MSGAVTKGSGSLFFSDLELLKQMFDRAGIEYSESRLDGTKRGVFFELTVERGYSGFVTSYEFNAEGALTDTGAYE